MDKMGAEGKRLKVDLMFPINRNCNTNKPFFFNVKQNLQSLSFSLAFFFSLRLPATWNSNFMEEKNLSSVNSTEFCVDGRNHMQSTTLLDPRPMSLIWLTRQEHTATPAPARQCEMDPTNSHLFIIGS